VGGGGHGAPAGRKGEDVKDYSDFVLYLIVSGCVKRKFGEFSGAGRVIAFE
jgi:hypothetical protein